MGGYNRNLNIKVLKRKVLINQGSALGLLQYILQDHSTQIWATCGLYNDQNTTGGPLVGPTLNPLVVLLARAVSH